MPTEVNSSFSIMRIKIQIRLQKTFDKVLCFTNMFSWKNRETKRRSSVFLASDNLSTTWMTIKMRLLQIHLVLIKQKLVKDDWQGDIQWLFRARLEQFCEIKKHGYIWLLRNMPKLPLSRKKSWKLSKKLVKIYAPKYHNVRAKKPRQMAIG